MSGGVSKRSTTRLLPPIKNPLFNPNQSAEEVRVSPVVPERARSGRLGGLANLFGSRHRNSSPEGNSPKPSSPHEKRPTSNHGSREGSKKNLEPLDTELEKSSSDIGRNSARPTSTRSLKNGIVSNDVNKGETTGTNSSLGRGSAVVSEKQRNGLLRRDKERPSLLENPAVHTHLSSPLERNRLRPDPSDSEVELQHKNGERRSPSRQKIEERKIERMTFQDGFSIRDEWRKAKESGDYKTLLKFLTAAFDSFADINAVFKKKTEDFNGEDLNESGIDHDFVRITYDIVLTLPQEVQKNVLKSIINSLLQDLKRKRNKDDLRAYVVLLQNPQFNNSATYVIFAHLLRQVSHLLDGEHQFLVHWFRRLPLSVFKSMITRIQQFISVRLFPTKGNELPPDEKCTWWIPSAVKVLALLNAANGLLSPPLVGHVSFYNFSLDHIDLMGEYYSWQNPGANAAKFSFCQYPFILSLGAKRYVMQKDSESQMIVMARKSLVEKVQRRQMPDMGMLFLNILVRRTHLISDSLNEIARKQKDLKKKLKVTFAGEPGLDMGGLTKEWFLLLIRRIFQPEYGMFSYNDKSRTYWFSNSNVENDSEFNLVGVLMGLAVYNSIILDIRFPPCCYKKLLSPAVVPYQDPNAIVGIANLGLEDLMEAMPDLGRGLKELLAYTGNVEEDLCQTFQISYSAFGEVITHDLKPNGSNIPVTNENRQEYVNLYVNYLLNKSIYRQFASFYHGFHSVCASNALIMLRPEEVEMLVCGNPELDMGALKKVTVYDGYTKNDAAIRYFWDVVLSFSLDLKKKLLLFVTGSDRVPIGGMGEMEFKIVRMDVNQSTRMLPMAHTCFNQLCLPPYRSRKILKQKLTIAVSNAEGFGIE